MQIDKLEFYITHACNLNCVNCNRFNNFNISGHFNHLDHYKEYKAWSKILKLNRITIIGGEPFLNPNFVDWVLMVRELWPDVKVFDCYTNGTQLKRHKDLYSLLIKTNLLLKVSLHTENSQPIIQDILDLLVHPVKVTFVEDDVEHVELWTTTYNNVKAESWPECNHWNDFKSLPIEIQKECIEDFNFGDEIFKDEYLDRIYTDRNGVKIELNQYKHFHESAVIVDNDKNIKLHNSDPNKAIDVCDMRHCHHFMDGKLYKCGVAALLPNFVEKFNINISAEDLDLINSYIPAEHAMTEEQLAEYEKNFVNGEVIPQCKFCPEYYSHTKINASNIKTKLPKRNS